MASNFVPCRQLSSESYVLALEHMDIVTAHVRASLAEGYEKEWQSKELFSSNL